MVLIAQTSLQRDARDAQHKEAELLGTTQGAHGVLNARSERSAEHKECTTQGAYNARSTRSEERKEHTTQGAPKRNRVFFSSYQ
ncbi:unnamed protein product [Nesidiocoris tenuis]|uniref:Uncharacterized protein n=1 Tax=Nesidiocoris tenuis TaxID=355587 RepID=A0A6H5HI63_9HEMI|nr:unnamed protein product [Nesidiocoris tenuis]CAB0016692.1 unnamed protein product [Nesidiocoris tenuis]